MNLEKLNFYKQKMDYYKSKLDIENQEGGFYLGKKLFLYNSKDLPDQTLTGILVMPGGIKSNHINKNLERKAYVIGEGESNLTFARSSMTKTTENISAILQRVSALATPEFRKTLDTVVNALDKEDAATIRKSIEDSIKKRESKMPVPAPDNISYESVFLFMNFNEDVKKLNQAIINAMTKVTEANRLTFDRWIAIDFKFRGANVILGKGNLEIPVPVPVPVPVLESILMTESATSSTINVPVTKPKLVQQESVIMSDSATSSTVNAPKSVQFMFY